MREIVIDTEITGLDPLDGHRIVEIGAVELINHFPTGQTFHRYLCPRMWRTPPCTGLLQSSWPTSRGLPRLPTRAISPEGEYERTWQAGRDFDHRKQCADERVQAV